MNALELMDRLGGEILANKIRVRIDGEIVIIGYLDEANEWVYTAEGSLLAEEQSGSAEEVAAPKTRKKAAAVVESVEPPAQPETVAAADATE